MHLVHAIAVKTNIASTSYCLRASWGQNTHDRATVLYIHDRFTQVYSIYPIDGKGYSHWRCCLNC